MTFAIKWGSFDSDDNNAGMVYFDAITASSQSYKGQVTSHPVDGGGNITDHFIRENPIFQFSGIITGTDLSSSSFLIKDEAGGSAFNAKQEPISVSVTNAGSKLLQFLPVSIGQFLDKQDANLVFDPETRTDLQYEIACRDLIVNLIQGIYYNKETQQLENKINLIDLYEFDDVNIRRITNNLVITSFNVNETPESGDALFFDITLEQVEFATLRKEALPEDVKRELQPKISSKKNKGRQDSSVKACSDPNSGSTSSDSGTKDSNAPGTSGDALKDVKYGETSDFSKLNTNGLGAYGV